MSGAVRQTNGYRWKYWLGATDLLQTDLKLQELRVTCTERVYCANAFRMDNSNTIFTMKYCACASIAFLGRIISWFVDCVLQIDKMVATPGTVRK